MRACYLLILLIVARVDSLCGDGVCDDGKTAITCRADCPVCGDGLCGPLETPASCPVDCALYPYSTYFFYEFGIAQAVMNGRVPPNATTPDTLSVASVGFMYACGANSTCPYTVIAVPAGSARFAAVASSANNTPGVITVRRGPVIPAGTAILADVPLVMYSALTTQAWTAVQYTLQSLTVLMYVLQSDGAFLYGGEGHIATVTRRDTLESFAPTAMASTNQISSPPGLTFNVAVAPDVSPQRLAATASDPCLRYAGPTSTVNAQWGTIRIYWYTLFVTVRVAGALAPFFTVTVYGPDGTAAIPASANGIVFLDTCVTGVAWRVACSPADNTSSVIAYAYSERSANYQLAC